jgi:hypothetical protein
MDAEVVVGHLKGGYFAAVGIKKPVRVVVIRAGYVPLQEHLWNEYVIHSVANVIREGQTK